MHYNEWEVNMNSFRVSGRRALRTAATLLVFMLALRIFAQNQSKPARPMLTVHVITDDGKPVPVSRYTFVVGHYDLVTTYFTGNGAGNSLTSVTLDATNSFKINWARADHYGLIVSGEDGLGAAEGEITLNTDGNFRDISVAYHRGASRIRGTARRADGTPFTNLVAIAPASPNRLYETFSLVEFTLKPDSQGRFVSQPLPPGIYRVAVGMARWINPGAPDYIEVTHTAKNDTSVTVREIPRGEKPVNTVNYIDLSKFPKRTALPDLHIRALDQNQKLMRSFSLGWYRAPADVSMNMADQPGGRDALKDRGPLGEYIIPAAPAGDYIVHIQSAEGFGWTVARVRPEPDGSYPTLDVPVITGNSRLTGQLNKADGTPYSGNVLIAFRDSPLFNPEMGFNTVWNVVAGADGKFSSPLLPPGRYSVSAREPRMAKEFLHDAGQDTEISLRPNMTQMIEGHVTAPDGKPLAGAIATLYPRRLYGMNPDQIYTAKPTDTSGRWSIELSDPINQTAGSNELTMLIRHPQFSPAVVELKTIEAKALAQIALDPPANLRVKLAEHRLLLQRITMEQFKTRLASAPWKAVVNYKDRPIYPLTDGDKQVTLNGATTEFVIPLVPRGVPITFGPSTGPAPWHMMGIFHTGETTTSLGNGITVPKGKGASEYLVEVMLSTN